MISRTFPLGASILLLLLGTAAAKIDLSALEGTFTCRVLANGIDSPQRFPGTAKVTIRVPRNGRSARIFVNGTIPTSTGAIPIVTSLRLRNDRQTRSTNVYMVPLAESTTGTGRYRQRSPRRVIGRAAGVVADAWVRQNFNVQVRTTSGRTRRISARFVAKVGDIPVLRFNMTGTGR